MSKILSLETNQLRLLYNKIGIELEKRNMQRTRLIDVSINIVFREGFQIHKLNKVIHIIRNDLSAHWKEIFKVLQLYSINNMLWDRINSRIELKFSPHNKYELYYDVLDKKEEIISAIEELFT
jgi:ribosomal protein L31E